MVEKTEREQGIVRTTRRDKRLELNTRDRMKWGEAGMEQGGVACVLLDIWGGSGVTLLAVS